MPDLRGLAIFGPTASGKSELAAELGREIGGEIINADSRQVYEGMSLGTGWPDGETMAKVRHHLYGFVPPSRRYSAGEFVEDATQAIVEVAARGNLPIVVGGTGLYLEALTGTMPLDRPVADAAVRDRVRREAAVHPHEALREWLGALDPAAAARVQPCDRYRTVRALEAALTARSDTALRPSADSGLAARERVRLKLVALDVGRDELHRRIARRVRAMFVAGLVDEALRVRRRFGDAPALTGLGYAEALAYARGEMTLPEAVEATIRRTCRYAKRQQTWLGRLHGVRLLDGANAQSAAAALRDAARETPLVT